MAKREGGTYSTKTLLNAKFKTFGFTGILRDILGNAPEGFTCIVYGESGHGKSTFTAILLVELAKHGKVYMNNTESGYGTEIQMTAQQIGMTEDTQIYWGDNHSVEAMMEKHRRNRSRFVGLDSIQDANMNYEQFKAMRAKCRKKGLVLIGWADGKKPEGKNAQSIEYKCDVKIRIHEGVALIKSRYGAKPFFMIPGVYEHWQGIRAKERALKKGIPIELPSAVAEQIKEKLKDNQTNT